MPTHEQRKREWLNSQEVADLLGVAVHTVRAWRSRKQGPPCYRMYQAIRYDRAEVEAWQRSKWVAGDGGGPAVRVGR
jgi:predicted DNA-binding transcriptional regulator AlpA